MAGPLEPSCNGRRVQRHEVLAACLCLPSGCLEWGCCRLAPAPPAANAGPFSALSLLNPQRFTPQGSTPANPLHGLTYDPIPGMFLATPGMSSNGRQFSIRSTATTACLDTSQHVRVGLAPMARLLSQLWEPRASLAIFYDALFTWLRPLARLSVARLTSLSSRCLFRPRPCRVNPVRRAGNTNCRPLAGPETSEDDGMTQTYTALLGGKVEWREE